MKDSASAIGYQSDAFVAPTDSLRVLHVIPAVAQRYGGTTAAVWSLASALRKCRGIDIEIATTDADGPRNRLPADFVPPFSGRVRVFRRDRSEQMKFSRDLAAWLRAEACDYDLLHIHSHWNFPVAAACRAASRAGVPYVLSPHGMLSDYSWGRSRWKKAVYWRLVERGNAFNAAAFHVTSNEERQEVLRLGVTAPVEVIPLGVDDEAFETPVAPGWFRARLPTVGSRPIVLYLSRLHPKKGITDFLLPAFAKLKCDAFLAIVGGEDPHARGYKAVIERSISDLALTNRAALLGPVSVDERWGVFDSADLFVLPSHGENFGIVVPEAMARSKPVVVTTGVQCAEHVRASQGGAIIEPSIDGLAHAMDGLLSDKASRLRAGSVGRAYVRKYLSWRQTAEQMAILYRRNLDRQLDCARASPPPTGIGHKNAR